MTPTTMEGRLTEIGRRIDGLYASAQSSLGETKSRMQRHVDALWRAEALARAVVREAYSESRQAVSEYADVVDYRVRLLELELDAAEASLRADIAEDPDTLGAAVGDELDAVDLYVERLQVRAATKAGSTRVEAEGAIRELRARRNLFAQRLDEIREASDNGAGDTTGELKDSVAAARAELARAIDATAAKFA